MGQRRIVIECNVTDRDIGSFVAEAKQKIDAAVKLPPGYLMTWGGQFENQQRAMKRFAIVVPITIAAIFLLLFSSFNSVKQAVLIILNIPFAMIGGILALVIGHFNLSVSASVGFIALFGVAVLNGVVMVSYFNELRREGMNVELAVIQGAVLRLRPVLITASVAALGLIPMLFATGPGSEIQKPLAAVVIGGLISSTLLTLFILPTLYKVFERMLAAGSARPDVAVIEKATTGAGEVATARAVAGDRVSVRRICEAAVWAGSDPCCLCPCGCNCSQLETGRSQSEMTTFSPFGCSGNLTRDKKADPHYSASIRRPTPGSVIRIVFHSVPKRNIRSTNLHLLGIRL